MEVGRRDHAKSGDSVAVARAVPVDVDAIALPKVVDVMEGAVSVEARYGCDVVAGDSDGRSLSRSPDGGPVDSAAGEAGADHGADSDPRD